MSKGGYYISSEDGINLYFRYYDADSSDVCICLLHSWGGDDTEFDALADFLYSRGFSITAIDIRGHGKSEGLPTHVRKIQLLLSDIKIFINESEKKINNNHFILLGHQWSAIFCIRILF